MLMCYMLQRANERVRAQRMQRWRKHGVGDGKKANLCARSWRKMVDMELTTPVCMFYLQLDDISRRRGRCCCCCCCRCRSFGADAIQRKLDVQKCVWRNEIKMYACIFPCIYKIWIWPYTHQQTTCQFLYSKYDHRLQSS